jgi:hypothetical protein
MTGDAPLANALISQGRTYCGVCGKCSGVLGVTDSAGALSIDRYYSEEFDILCLVGEDGKILWRTSTTRLASGSIDVRLPAGTPPPTQPGVCPPFR